MPNENNNWDKLFAHLNRIEKNTATKDDVAELKRTLEEHTMSLDGIIHNIQTLQTEKASQKRHNERMNRRTEALADHIGIDISNVDADNH